MNDTSRPAKAGPSFTDKEALDFHAQGRPGKLEIAPTKPMATQRDLSLAYSPGVAVPVKAIAEDPVRAFAAEMADSKKHQRCQPEQERERSRYAATPERQKCR